MELEGKGSKQGREMRRLSQVKRDRSSHTGEERSGEKASQGLTELRAHRGWGTLRLSQVSTPLQTCSFDFTYYETF